MTHKEFSSRGGKAGTRKQDAARRANAIKSARARKAAKARKKYAEARPFIREFD